MCNWQRFPHFVDHLSIWLTVSLALQKRFNFMRATCWLLFCFLSAGILETPHLYCVCKTPPTFSFGSVSVCKFYIKFYIKAPGPSAVDFWGGWAMRTQFPSSPCRHPVFQHLLKGLYFFNSGVCCWCCLGFVCLALTSFSKVRWITDCGKLGKER